MDELDAPIPPTRKAMKKMSKQHHQQQTPAPSKVKHSGASSRSALLLPPSFIRAQSPKASSRHQDRFSGLWEWYYDEDDPGAVGGGADAAFYDDGSRLKNIRGFLLKRRKSPLKGWHKRYFVVEKGFLYFSRTYSQMIKGKNSGCLDLGLAFIHCEGSSRRINIDGENLVLHLKTKNASHFAAWSSCLISHEMYRKTQLASGKSSRSTVGGGNVGVASEATQVGGINMATNTSEETNQFEEWVGKTHRTIGNIKKDLDAIHESLETMAIYVRSPRGSGTVNVTPPSGSTAVLPGSVGGVVNDKIDTISETSSIQNGGGGGSGSDSTGSGTSKKNKFAIRKTKKDKKKESVANVSPDQVAPSPVQVLGSLFDEQSSLSSSSLLGDQAVIRDDFTAIAKLVYAQFCEVMERLEKLDNGFNSAVESTTAHRNRRDTIISNQLLLLRQTMTQNAELRDRLTQIQSIATGSESKVHLSTPVGGSSRRTPSQSYHRGSGSIPRFDSFMSLQSTLSDKFFDALDEVHEFSSSEDEAENSEEEESGEESDTELFSSLPHTALTSLSLPTSAPLKSPTAINSPTVLETSITEEDEPADSSSHDTSPDPQDGMPHAQKVVRRRKLPAPISDTADFSLWSLLRKNIGKDLSKVSMPVSMNEPLSALQRICEDLEYSELLDQASNCPDPFDRMVRVAAFAVSSYALSYHRAGRKPFNPILGETYECIREDKGFKFIAEQVSHHPPIAACHCTSPNFQFWQDARIKSKFWGKSMEVFPIGVTNVVLPKHDDHYRWNKVTSCIHNVLGGQRWVDQYGEMTITNKDLCSCKLTFHKTSYWASKKCYVDGGVYDAEGTKVRHIFGAWNEAMFCGNEGEEPKCIWRIAKMPPDSEAHYGFSYFAIELNELLESQQQELPCTDCRFRPDQRLLENGCVQEAESEKRRVEQVQREARAERERVGEDWTPNFFQREEDEDGGKYEKWVTNHTYWKLREKGFNDIDLPTLW